MAKLVLIRGLPGSGKSTLARQMLVDAGQDENDGHFEADMYFVMRDGQYHFNPALIKNAHAWCQAATKDYIKTQLDYMTDLCVVSNTFVKQWEMLPYIEMAKEFGIELDIITATGQYQNVHGVPAEVIERMRNSWEFTPSY